MKLSSLVKMEKRNYHGQMSFSDLRNYLSLFASKNQTDRKVDTGLGHKRVRDMTIKSGSKVHGLEFNFDDFKGNLVYPEDIQLVHVTDTFTMNYPNLIVFQTFYG